MPNLLRASVVLLSASLALQPPALHAQTPLEPGAHVRVQDQSPDSSWIRGRLSERDSAGVSILLASGQTRSIPWSTIRRLQVGTTGSAVTGLVQGAAAGFVVAGLGAATLAARYGRDGEGSDAVIFAAVIGAGIGGGIGALLSGRVREWREVPGPVRPDG